MKLKTTRVFMNHKTPTHDGSNALGNTVFTIFVSGEHAENHATFALGLA